MFSLVPNGVRDAWWSSDHGGRPEGKTTRKSQGVLLRALLLTVFMEWLEFDSPTGSAKLKTSQRGKPGRVSSLMRPVS